MTAMPEIQPRNQDLKSLQGLHLWHAPLSSCSQRVRITIEETGKTYESHLVRLERDEHASLEYQAIHPKGLVPALVDDGRLFIESIDIIQEIAGAGSRLLAAAEPDLLALADNSQADLKLLTHEFLFRAHPAPTEAQAEAFDTNHRNDWLRQFKRDFAAGFGRDRIAEAVQRTAAGLEHLDAHLGDGRPFLSGDEYSLSDIAWTPNAHRLSLMNWPFERTPHLARWFERVRARPSFREAILDWQDDALASRFADYTAQRIKEGTDVTRFGVT